MAIKPGAGRDGIIGGTRSLDCREIGGELCHFVHVVRPTCWRWRAPHKTSHSNAGPRAFAYKKKIARRDMFGSTAQERNGVLERSNFHARVPGYCRRLVERWTGELGEENYAGQPGQRLAFLVMQA